MRLLRDCLYISLAWVIAIGQGFAEVGDASQDSLKSIPGPEVTAVYPSTDRVPENLLRMYLVFSQPMKTVGNLDKIKLLDDKDQEVKGAIFGNVYELWDAEQKQLTLLFEPARVKTGLVANESFGRALQSGKTYRLLIADLENIHHQKMNAPFVKTLHVTDADQQPPATEDWQLDVPVAHTSAALAIDFPQNLDRVSLLRHLIVTDAENQIIKGSTRITEGEMRWAFSPDTPWPAGSYWLYVNRRLEDPAGNNLNGLFDHKVGSLKHSREDTIVKIPFTVSSQIAAHDAH